MEKLNSKKEEKQTEPKEKADHWNDGVTDIVMPYLTDPEDRASASMVCKSWKQGERKTREHVTMGLCYAASPYQLSRQFPNLKHLTLKGKPRPAKLDLLPGNWGGYASPWVKEIAISMFRTLKSVQFKRMIVTDSDLDFLAKSQLHQLVALTLHRCLGFSTDGLMCITKRFRTMEKLIFDKSIFLEKDGAWLHELAQNNTSLKVLNFYLTKHKHINPEDLETLATRCSSLVSVKIGGEFEMRRLLGFFRAATNLEEFFGGSFKNYYDDGCETYIHMSFPKTLRRVGICCMKCDDIPALFPIAANIRELDLAYAWLLATAHWALLQQCPNLEVLKTKDVIEDEGLSVLAKYCKKLKKLRIEPSSTHPVGFDDHYLGVTQIGLSYIAQGCLELEYIHVNVTDIDNASLHMIGQNLKNLRHFRLVLLSMLNPKATLPLDDGVRSLLMGCKKLELFGLSLQEGGLTHVGMDYIGQYSENVRSMTLVGVGGSDEGLIALSKGCAKLEKLEMCFCGFSDQAIANAVMKLPSLKYIWAQDDNTIQGDLSLMTCPFWSIERIPSRMIIDEHGEPKRMYSQLLAYYSLDDKRTDYPNTVLHLGRPINFFQ